MIGIIGAMSVEVENLIAVMTDKSTQTVSSVVYYTGRIENIDCVVAKCGVGKVAAAVCTQTMILNYHPSAVINVGVAGVSAQTSILAISSYQAGWCSTTWIPPPLGMKKA